MTRARRVVVGVAAIVAAIGVGAATPADADGGLRATGTVMTGAQEAPGPGDPDGVGAAAILINANRGRICYALAVKHIAPATMAHIHVGAAGQPGPVVVNLDPPTRGFSANCTTVEVALARAIAAAPGDYYVNVHNDEFQAGAVRGQLG